MSDQKPNLGFTLSDPEFWNRSDQDEAFRALREQAPVSWHEEIASEWFPEGG
jgi:hypothetical protein